MTDRVSQEGVVDLYVSVASSMTIHSNSDLFAPATFPPHEDESIMFRSEG